MSQIESNLKTFFKISSTLNKTPSERPSASDILNEPLIGNHVKSLIHRVCETSNTAPKMAALINSLASLGDMIDEEAYYGEYDDRSTLKPTPRSSLRSNDSK
jgi:hypothetical protein